ncbi:Uma2 family endonuclease [Streptomyces sp. NRRL F-5630]|uniref:Uma2 family endonuclease n=1 Tax=Streptomyces sp. NRRL F-5630 TaxID=1463864 RepID=UPI003EB78690
MATAVDHRPQMSTEDFEELSAHAPETVTLEFLGGKIGVKAVPDGYHNAIMLWLLRRCIQARPDLDLWIEQSLQVEGYRKGRARVDGVLAPVDHYAVPEEWVSPEGALMAVEVTSYDADTNRRDRVEKPAAYAEAGIPLYLLIDRDSRESVVHSEPEGGKYRTIHSYLLGADFSLPGLGIALATEDLKRYVR